jgi:hypothetical protein
MKIFIIGTFSALLLTACGPRDTLVCDREAQIWNKFDTAFDTCTRVLEIHYEETTHDEPTLVVPTPVVPTPVVPTPVVPTPVVPTPVVPTPVVPTPVVPTPVGQNPGNNKPVGNSPFDGEKGEVPSKKDKLKVPPK